MPQRAKILTIFEYPHGSSLTYYESLVTIQGQISEFIDSRFFEPILLNLEALLS